MRISDWISDVCSSDLGCLSFDYHTAEGSLWGQKIRYKISETAKTFSFPHADGKQPLWLMHKWGTGCDTRSRVIFAAEGDADRRGVVWGKGVSVRVDRGGRRIRKKKNKLQDTF